MDQITKLVQFSTDDAHALLAPWQATMRAEAKSPGTIDTYTHGLRTYLTWCTTTGEPPLNRTSMTTWMSEMLAAGAAPGSARIRQLGVRRFVTWFIATGHVPVDPFAGIKGTQADPEARHAAHRRPTARPDRHLRQPHSSPGRATAPPSR